MKTKTILFINLLLLFTGLIHAANSNDLIGRKLDINVIKTTVPFLTIAPDSRAGGIGDAGVATSPDLASQHWNPAKYVFMKQKGGFDVSFTPWLKNLTGDNSVYLAYISGYYKFDAKQSLSASLRYFNLGTIALTDNSGNPLGTSNPNEFAVDAAYSRLFSEHLSGGLLFRFIRSDIAGGSANGINNIQYNPGKSFAADISMYYQHPLEISKNKAEYALGFDISNIGTKMSYSQADKKEFIPTNLRLGGRFSYDADEYNKISVLVEFNKLLVPTPPIRNTTGDTIIYGKDDNVGTIQGMIQSFYDAPDGFTEEMHEIAYSVGAEYWYREQFAIRAGYFNENKTKGNRKYVTCGVGLHLNVFSLDFSYLIPTVGGKSSPLANTMRFTIGFIFK
jgi:hypothetical protein